MRLEAVRDRRSLERRDRDVRRRGDRTGWHGNGQAARWTRNDRAGRADVEAPAFVSPLRAHSSDGTNLGATGISNRAQRRGGVDTWRHEQRLLATARDDNRGGGQKGELRETQALQHFGALRRSG